MFTRLALALLTTMMVVYGENHFEEAGREFGIDPLLLWSIAKVESNFNPNAINKNKNGTYDLGIMQINSIHLPLLKRYGISLRELHDPKTNIKVGAWVLAGCIKKHGYKWNAVTCYNGRIRNNPYGLKVYKVLQSAKQIPIIQTPAYPQVQTPKMPPDADIVHFEEMTQPSTVTKHENKPRESGEYLVIDTL